MKDKATANAPAPNVLLSNSQRWVMQLGIMKKHIKAILVKHGMRGWECVIPHSSYPLPKEEVEKVSMYSTRYSQHNINMRPPSYKPTLTKSSLHPTVLMPRLTLGPSHHHYPQE